MVEQRRVASIGGKREEQSNKLGQQTGTDSVANAAEAGKLLGMITRACSSREELEEATDIRTGHFISDLIQRTGGYGDWFWLETDPLTVSGKQLFWLRDIKDKLIEAGKL